MECLVSRQAFKRRLAAVTAVILRHVARLGRGLVIQTDYARGIWAKSHGAVSTPSSRQSRAA